MKNWNMVLVSLFFVMGSFGQELESPSMALYSTTNAAQREVVWSTRPGIRYVLQESSDLQSWSTVDGFPSEASALAQQHVIELAGASNAFFRVQVLDEQPPEILASYPDPDAFGVGRFSEIRIELEDASGINSNSISLTVGSNGTYSVLSPQITYSTNSLVFDLGGDTALGGYGTTQQVTLVVADILGNATNWVWEFELEEEIVAASNLFVFGSPDAQRAGQQLSGLSATVAASFNGPVRMSSSAESWEIDTVTSNEVVLSYTGTNAPAFDVGQTLANLAPAHKDEIFYRRIETISDNAVSNFLTLGTVDILLADVMESGSFSLGDEAAMFLEFNTNGTLVSAKKISKTIDLPVIGKDFSGSTIWEQDGLTVTLEEGCFTLTNKLELAMKTRWGSVQRFDAELRGDLNISCVPLITATGHYDNGFEKELWSKSFWTWTSAGIVPVGIEVETSITASGKVQLDTEATVTAGFRQTGILWVNGTYLKDDGVKMDRGFDLDPFEKVPLSYTLDGSGFAEIALIPQVDCRLYGSAGIYLNTDPRLRVEGSVSISNNIITEAGFLMGAYADVNVGLSLIGDDDVDLPALRFDYFSKEWTAHYENEPLPDPPLVITTHPKSTSAKYGDNVTFTVQADGGTGSYAYQWFQNGKLLPGEIHSKLNLSRIDYDFSGDYTAQIQSGTSMTNSGSAYLNVVSGGGTGNTSGMVCIPGGTNSGVDPDFGAYSLTVDTFYMDRTEVTKAQWEKVYLWAIQNGYNFDNRGFGKGANHPVHSVSWFDCVKWCNAKSEMGGRTPCYTSAGVLFRTGSPPVYHSMSVSCNYDANGYRLPTNDEWEYAARGGRYSSRFSWGNEISHRRANYYSTGVYHPAYSDGVTPYTSSVGSFYSNGYGLYDMIGNMKEWCYNGRFNQYGNIYSRSLRGGGWNSSAFTARCGSELCYNPLGSSDSHCFRAVCR